MHPYKPEMDGQDLTDNKDPNGKHLFVEFARVAKEKGEGFVDYFWPKYGGQTPAQALLREAVQGMGVGDRFGALP